MSLNWVEQETVAPEHHPAPPPVTDKVVVNVDYQAPQDRGEQYYIASLVTEDNIYKTVFLIIMFMFKTHRRQTQRNYLSAKHLQKR